LQQDEKGTRLGMGIGKDEDGERNAVVVVYLAALLEEDVPLSLSMPSCIMMLLTLSLNVTI
jgi:hypothetical protein